MTGDRPNTPTTFTLPAFFSPALPDPHPQTSTIATEITAWVEEHLRFLGTLQRTALTDIGVQFATRFCPDGELQHLVPIGACAAWGFAFQDARFETTTSTAEFVDLGARFARALDAPVASLPQQDPLLTALGVLFERFREAVPAVQVRRLAGSYRTWWLGEAWERTFRERGTPVSLEDYVLLRPACGAAAQMTTVIEIGLGCDVSDEDLHEPALRAAIEAAWLVAFIDNDLISYQREAALDEDAHNIITVLHGHHPLATGQELADQAVALRDRVMSCFNRLHARLTQHPDAEVRRLIDGVARCIPGNIGWSLTVLRYRGTRLTPTFTDKPSDPGTAPLPIPSIAWWWEL